MPINKLIYVLFFRNSFVSALKVWIIKNFWKFKQWPKDTCRGEAGFR